MLVVEMRAAHWPIGVAITITRHRTGYSVVFPNAEKESKTPTGFKVWAIGRFGPATTDKILEMIP